MRREAAGCAAVASIVALVLLWAGPPGSDAAAHVYQRGLLLEHGFAIWNNFWYAGRYSFVTYSLGYYPLAALLGIVAAPGAYVTADPLGHGLQIRHVPFQHVG